MIAVTGDLVDGSVRDLAHHTQPLGRLSARHGAFFVTGNHEYYSGVHAWIEEVRGLGLSVLLNEHVILDHEGASVLVAGVTDYGAGYFDVSHHSDPVAALSGAPDDVGVRLLLAHQPRSAFAAASAGSICSSPATRTAAKSVSPMARRSSVKAVIVSTKVFTRAAHRC